MSAPALPNTAFPPSEFQVLRAVSSLTWNADSLDDALSSVESIALRVPGIKQIQYEQWGTHSTVAGASAVAPVAANGQNYGQIRILFDPHTKLGLESPFRFVRFLGQQLGLLLHRTSLQRQRQVHYSRLNALDRNIRRRKLIHHASAILARERGVSQLQATEFLVRYARENRKPLLDVADSFLFGANFQKVAQVHAR